MGLFKKKIVERTFIDGAESKQGELPVPRPADAPALGPSQAPAQELSHLEEFGPECEVCRDYGWYCDTLGVCHNCPRCNPKSLKNPADNKTQKNVEPDYEAEEEEDRPKNNLNRYAICPKCGKKSEVHWRKKQFKCSCGNVVEREVQ